MSYFGQCFPRLLRAALDPRLADCHRAQILTNVYRLCSLAKQGDNALGSVCPSVNLYRISRS